MRALELLISLAMLKCNFVGHGLAEVSMADFDRQPRIQSKQSPYDARLDLLHRPEVPIQPCQGFFDLLSSGNIMASVINHVAFIIIRSSKKTEHQKL